MAAATALGSLAAMIGGAAPAHADYGPSSYDATTGQGDVVCVGSDTVQIMGNFLADGDNLGRAGYNGAGNKFKLVSLDATADANVRVAYSLTSTVASPRPLSPTVYLRGGAFPAQRPNGSGSGYNALIADVTTTGSPEHVNCVRGSSLPSQTNYNNASTNGWGGLHVVRLATDDEAVAASVTGTTNVPFGLSRAQLTFIYSATTQPTWSAIPGGYTPPNPAATVGTTGNCPSCLIQAMLPQSGSGTRNTFIADLQNAGCVCTSFASWINQQSEENDPTALTGNAAPADTIIPFSGDRLKLWQKNYFHNPFVAASNTPSYPGGAVLAAGIQMLNQAPSDGALVYNDNRGLYITYRAIDDSAGAWQPNTTQNWASVLFSPGSFLGSSFTAKNPIQDAGGTYAYLDCGSAGPAGWASAGCINNVQ